MCSLLLLFALDTTEWNKFWGSKHRWSRTDQCSDAELFLRWDAVLSPPVRDSFAGSTGHIDLRVSQPQASAGRFLPCALSTRLPFCNGILICQFC